MAGSVRHMSAALTALILVLASIWAIPPRAYACGCIHDTDDPALVDLAEVIFTGTVIEERSLGYNRTYTFAVTRVYKGSAYSEQRVQTASQGERAGWISVGQGRSWCSGGTPRTGPCWPTPAAGPRTRRPRRSSAWARRRDRGSNHRIRPAWSGRPLPDSWWSAR